MCNVLQLQKLRINYCKLQKFSSGINSIFSEITFMWLIKIVARFCLSSYDIVTLSWKDDDLSMQGISALDGIFDLAHLAVLCTFATGIIRMKSEILQSLMVVGGINPHLREGSLQEIHFFVSSVGHSNIGMTAGDIFPLNKNTGITLLGVVMSYVVVIYQISN